MSKRNAGANGTGIINPESPTMNKMLKILLPTIFPIAISAFPFIAADIEVHNSGREVPNATIVNPINLWLNPNAVAINVADLTTKFEPATIKTKPINIFKHAVKYTSDSAINYLNTVINYLQQNSIPSDFYRYNTLINTISDLKKQRDKLTNFKSWVVNSNKDYDTLISSFDAQASKLPTGRIKKRTGIVVNK